MNDVIGWLVIGTVLVYLGFAGIAEPLDNRITSIVGPYIMVPVGLLLFLRGFLAVLSTAALKPYHRFAIVTGYPAMTLGVALIFARWLIDSFWVRAVVGLVIFGIGLLLRLSINWSKNKQLTDG